MALRWLDGFETYGASGATATALNTALQQAYDYANVTDAYPDGIIGDGRNGGLCLKWQDYDNDSYLHKTFDKQDTWVVGFAFQIPYEYESSWMAVLQTSTSALVAAIRIDGYKRVSIYFDGQYHVCEATLGTKQWYYFEWKHYCHATAGTSELRINGKTVVSLTNQDTSSSTMPSRVKLYSFGKYGSFDDLYICDGSGTSLNDFLGPQEVRVIRPTSDDTSEWDASDTVSHNELLNENPYDGDSSYVYSSTPGEQDLFGYSDVTLDTINAIRVVAITRVDGSNFDLVQVCDTGTVATNNEELYDTSYGISEWFMTTDPDGSAWSATTLNSAKFGIEVG